MYMNKNVSVSSGAKMSFAEVEFSTLNVRGTITNSGLIEFDNSSNSTISHTGEVGGTLTNNGIISFAKSKNSRIKFYGEIDNQSGAKLDFKNSDYCHIAIYHKDGQVELGKLVNSGLIDFTDSQESTIYTVDDFENNSGASVLFNGAKDDCKINITKNIINSGVISFGKNTSGIKTENCGITVSNGGSFTNKDTGKVLFDDAVTCSLDVYGDFTNEVGGEILFDGTQSCEFTATGIVSNLGLISFSTSSDNMVPYNSGFTVTGNFVNGNVSNADAIISFLNSKSCGFHVDGNITNSKGAIIKFENAIKEGTEASEFTVSGTLDNLGKITFDGSEGSGFHVTDLLTNSGDGVGNNGLISFDNSQYSGIIAENGLTNLQGGKITFNGSEGQSTVDGNQSEIRVTAGNLLNEGTIDFTGSIDAGIDVQVGDLTNTYLLTLGEQSYATVVGDLNNNSTNALFKILSGTNGTGTLITKGNVTNSGKFEIYRFLKEDISNNGYWQLVSSPMGDKANGNFEKSETFYGHFLNWYDQGNGQFNAYSSRTEDLIVGQGYVSKLKYYFGINVNPNPLLFDQTMPNTGDIPIDIFDDTNGTEEPFFHLPENFNLIGNPYPSNLDWDILHSNNSLFSGNIADKYYYYIDEDTTTTYGVFSGWKTYSSHGDPMHRYISTGQAFGIECINTGVLTFRNSQRTHNIGGGFNKKEDNIKTYIELVSKSHGYVDVSKIRFNEEATRDYDFNIDAYKLNSFRDECPNASFMSDDGKRQYICEMPETESVNLGFVMHSDGEVVFSMKNLEGFREVVLEDKQENTFTDLTKANYNFNYIDGEEQTGRFTVHFTKETLGEEESNIGIKVYYSSNNLNIESSEEMNDANLNLYNINGQLIFTKNYKSLKKESLELYLKRV